MTFEEIATAVGIEAYPTVLNEIYANMPQTGTPACDLALIDRLQSTYNIFGTFYELVRDNAIKLNGDDAKSAWVRTAVRFFADADVDTACTVPVPKPDGTLLTHMLPLYILLPFIPNSIERYQNAGFSDEELENILKEYKVSLSIVQKLTGMPGLNQSYYDWLVLFAKAMIFQTEGLQFELRTLPQTALYLRNRQTGQVLPLMVEGTFHASGVQQLGSKNYEDETGAFTPVFSEDTENYYGHGVFDGVVALQSQRYSKKEWDCIARPGAKCLGIHVPRGRDISREATLKACRSAQRIARKRFPDHAINVVYGTSWLLNPKLRQIQGETARTTQFMECFTKYPDRDTSGNSLFKFIFWGRPKNLADLPEHSSLQRKLKKLYLDGDCLHTYSGIIFVEDQI